MAKRPRSTRAAQSLAELKRRLQEAEDTINAIRDGHVEALVVHAPEGEQIYTLRSADQPYRLMVEQMREGALTLAADGTILYCNQRFADMLELPLEKVIGSQLPASLSSSAWTKVSAIVTRRNGVVKHETALQRASSKPLPVHLAASRLPVGDRSVVCLVVTDLTEQKEKAELRVAKEVAEKANAEKDEFLAKLSHELRTPLTPTLITAAELEQNDTLPDKVRQQVAMIRRNIELEARLIDDLLDLTRIARGKLELRFAPTDVGALSHYALVVIIAARITLYMASVSSFEVPARRGYGRRQKYK